MFPLPDPTQPIFQKQLPIHSELYDVHRSQSGRTNMNINNLCTPFQFLQTWNPGELSCATYDKKRNLPWKSRKKLTQNLWHVILSLVTCAISSWLFSRSALYSEHARTCSLSLFKRRYTYSIFGHAVKWHHFVVDAAPAKNTFKTLSFKWSYDLTSYYVMLVNQSRLWMSFIGWQSERI